LCVKGSDVEQILQDHQYSVVTDPRSQDLVIYRDVTGNILHTALVQALLPDGTVIAESKWGTLQRFLHLPEDQPYSTIFQFYRTKRPDHWIQVQPQKARKSDDTESDKVLRTVASQQLVNQAVSRVNLLGELKTADTKFVIFIPL
jgi:hypothetical protein